MNFLSRKHLATALIILAVLFSWSGILDERSDHYTDESIIAAGSTYAIARSINALVSVMQTSTVEFQLAIGGSISPGEILDPVNDVIERFSQVMFFALGSLAIQKVLLGITTHHFFDIILFLCGAALIAQMLFRNTTATYIFTKKLFLFLIFVRFAITVAVLLNGVVDYFFLSEQITEGNSKLQEFHSSVEELSNEGNWADANPATINRQIAKEKDELKSLDKKGNGMNSQLTRKQALLEKEEDNLKELRGDMSTIDRLNFMHDDPKTDAQKQKISSIKSQIENLESEKEVNEDLIKDVNDKIKFLEDRAAGKPLDWTESIKVKLSSIGDTFGKFGIEAIGDRVSDSVRNIAILTALFVLKTALIPLLFLYLFGKATFGIWKIKWVNPFPMNAKT